MENKITKNLIIVLGAIIFSFALTNSVSAYVPNFAFSNNPVIYQYDTGNQDSSQSSYYYQSGYNPIPPVPVNPVNPYYMNQGYPQYAYYQQSGYTNNTSPTTTKPSSSVVNNYYYQTAPTTTKTATTTTTNNNTPTIIPNTVNDTNGVNYSNNLGASAYYPYSQTTGNGITALSLRGSGGFMPSSIWQWIFVFILILVIIIIARMFIHKPTPEESHTVVHAH